MPVLVKVAIALEVVIVGIHGFLLADREATAYPLGATAIVDVLAVPAEPGPSAVLAAVAEEVGTPLARVRYGSDPQGTFRTLAFTPSSAAPDPAQDERLFGFALRTRVDVFDAADEVVGRWLGFGTPEAAHRLSTELTARGFEVRVAADDRLDRLRAWISADPTWLLVDLAGLLAVLVAALVSSSRASRIRAVRQLHGASVLATAAAELSRYALLALGASVAGLALWAALAAVGWGGRDIVTGPGAIVVAGVALAAAGSIVACAVAVAIAVRSSPTITSQLAGRRPLAIIQAVGAVAFVAVLAGCFVTASQVGSSTARLAAAISAQELWANEPDARSIALANTSESVVQANLGAWSRLVDEVRARDRLLLSYPERSCALALDERPCLFVDETYLEEAGLPLGREAAAALAGSTGVPTVHVLVPPSARADPSAIAAQIRSWVGLQRDLRCAERGCDPSTTAAARVEVVRDTEGDRAVPVYSSRFLLEGAVAVDPILVVVPADVVSADFTLAAASSGNLIFFAPGDELAAMVDEVGVRALVFSIDRPIDLAAGAALEARIELARYGTVLIAGLALAAALMVVLAAAYVERRRTPLFLLFLHGASFARRYAPFFLTLAAGVSAALLASLAIGSGAGPVDLATRLALGAALGLATIPVLLVHERRFRADFLKRG